MSFASADKKEPYLRCKYLSIILQMKKLLFLPDALPTWQLPEPPEPTLKKSTE